MLSEIFSSEKVSRFLVLANEINIVIKIALEVWRRVDLCMFFPYFASLSKERLITM